ncbi:DUF2852 domain-containing protein [Frigidibacter albus]|uniref:DUF2852 domain-containing protein n=1 Tax=Frigidibacter albus TaxID=1465486 RepID=A0A6L8VKL0_9RHOB|nr:DUF2852 domain-containing protein [Frigidibacter albus]MZQ90584.1 DUF2852 domain-containing protein [Frigidibacter albus]NBE32760.1 DUF2852 domain-containing protein [Frigidibacter albus]GGH60775.1 hypothetical protein GCM10011341_33340 [Frigidibacter albus]
MTHTDTFPRQSWLGRAEAWLDDRGKGAWIALMVLSFIFVWPVGLAILAYMIWSKRMFGSCSSRRRSGTDFTRGMGRGHRFGQSFGSSGNTAFDAYKSDTLARLEREQEEFESFLRRLRESKDKSEFDQYMTERAREAANPSPQTAPVPQSGDDRT